MTKQELLHELNQDTDWVRERAYGISIKYEKVIKKVTDRKILGFVNYTTPKHNKVLVAWTTYYISGSHIIAPVTFFCCPTNRGYQYINLVADTRGTIQIPIIYTSHAMDRLKERSNLTIQDVIRIGEKQSYGRCFLRDYEYEGRQSKALVLEGHGMFIMVEQEWGLYAVTYIDKDRQGEVQNQISDDYDKTLWKSNGAIKNVIEEVVTARSL